MTPSCRIGWPYRQYLLIQPFSEKEGDWGLSARVYREMFIHEKPQ